MDTEAFEGRFSNYRRRKVTPGKLETETHSRCGREDQADTRIGLMQ